MCGISGFLSTGELRDADWMRSIGRSMADTMVHRGPDDEGVWLSPDGRCVLSHRRLSIIDTSRAGQQPMVAPDGASAIAFNGELYSFRELRADLEAQGRSFRTRTDTEVFLQGYEQYDRALFDKIDAMYALAIYDSRERRLSLARDPFGKKPLYWAQGKDWIAFASELHALACIPEIDDALEADVLAEYFALQYIDAPRTIYRGVQKLRPGHRLTWEASWGVQIERFFEWSPSAEASPRSDDDLAEELEEILLRATKRRMIADVPLGAFLSGGVDSATVCALMTKALGGTVKTFSIGFEGTQDSEHLLAREMAAELGTEHYDKVLAPDILALADDVARVLDEPNADSSCLPTWLLSGFAREQVTVCLSGDGGDELFGGYGRYFDTIEEAARPKRGEWSLGRAYYSPRILVYDDPWVEELFGVVPQAHAERMQALRDDLDHGSWPVLNRLRKSDAEHYLPGAVLPKVDRMSMQHSLEVRSPLLGLEVARFAERLGPDSLYAKGKGKLLLKRVTEKFVPRAWLDRPKMGFGMPMQLWGRDNILRVARERILANRESSMRRVFDTPNLEAFFERQERDFTLYQVWSMLILEQWLQSHRASWDAVRDACSAREGATALASSEGATPAVVPDSWHAHSAPIDVGVVVAISEETDKPLVFAREFPQWLRAFGEGATVVSPLPAPEGFAGRWIDCEWDREVGVLGEAVDLEALHDGVAVVVEDPALLGQSGITELATAGMKVGFFRGRGSWGRLDLTAWVREEKAPVPDTTQPNEQRFRLRRPLFSGYAADGGHCYRVSSRRLRSLHRKHGEHVWANCVVYEDGRMLPYPDRPHSEIRTRGLGRHSLWDDNVFFSASDNSDPNQNGRRYEVSLLLPEPPAPEEDVEEAPPIRFGLTRLVDLYRDPYAAFVKLARKERAPVVKAPKKVMFYVGSLPPGGAERQLCYLAAGLSRQGLDVLVQTMYPLEGPEGHYRPMLEAAGISTCDSGSVHPDYDFRQPTSPEFRRLFASLPPSIDSQIWRAYTHIQVASPDVLHCYLDQPNIFGAIAGWMAGVPRIVLSARNTTPDHFEAIYTAYMLPWYRALANSPRVVFSGNTTSGCRDYERWIGLEEGRFSVVHNGVDSEVIQPPAPREVEALRRDFELEHDTPVVLGVFRLSGEKRPMAFLDVCEDLRARFPNLRAFIAGIGPMADEVKARVRSGPLRSCVRLLGRRGDVAALYGLADVLCLTSEYEGMPNAILEAMLCECPVVATSVGGCPDLIESGRTGYLRAPDDLEGFADDVATLLGDEEMRRQFGSAGRRRVLEQFTVDRLVRESSKLYV